MHPPPSSSSTSVRRALLCQPLWTQYFSFVLWPRSSLICIPTPLKASSIQNRSPCEPQGGAQAGMPTLIPVKAEIHHGTPPLSPARSWAPAPKGCLSTGFMRLCPQPPCCLSLQFISTFSGSSAPRKLSTYCPLIYCTHRLFLWESG